METKKNDAQIVQKVEKAAINIQEQLEKELAKLTRKKELADKRAFFLLKKEALTKYRNYVLNDLGQMETKFAKISFVGLNEYEREVDRININNPEFITKYIDYLITDIDGFVNNIEKELLTEKVA